MIDKKQHIGTRVAILFITLLTLVAIIGPFIINNSPSFVSAEFIDLASVNGVAPGINNHILGADLLGRDILSGLINGAAISLRIAFFSILLALLIALFLALITSYIGNDSIRLNLLQITIIAIIGLLFFYYFFIAFPIHSLAYFAIRIGGYFIIIGIGYIISQRFLSYKNWKTISIPMDSIGMKFYELFFALPKLILIILLLGLSPNNTATQLAFIMGLLLWPIFYRYIRIEILKMKSTERYLSLRNLGLNHGRIIFLHFIPSMIQAITTPVLFTLISAILIEATLSFLGLGLSGDIVTWGSILTQARLRIDAWWLAIFPGLLIFFTILSLHVIIKKTVEES